MIRVGVIRKREVLVTTSVGGRMALSEEPIREYVKR